MIPKRKAMKPMIGVMKRNEVLGLVVDHHTTDSEGELVQFFGHEVRHTPTAAILARKFDAVVIPVYSRTTDFQHWTIEFHQPIELEKTSDMAHDIKIHTQKQASITEKVIRQKPDEWFWLHRRWKLTHLDKYRQRADA